MDTSAEATQNNEPQSIPNLDLAYEYTKMLLETRNKSIDNLNTRLGIFLGFGGVALRFGLEMPDHCLTCLILKICVLTLSAVSVWMCATGLIAGKLGIVIKPGKLMGEEWFYQPNPRVKAFITNTLAKLIEDLEDNLVAKAERLKNAIILLGVSAVAFSISTIIASIFKICLTSEA